MIDVVWSEKSSDSDNRSHYASSMMLNETFDAALGDTAVHRNGFEQLPGESRGAVVVIHGEHQARESEELARQIARLEWSVIIVFGDEPSEFPTQKLLGNRRKLWVQYPVPGRHNHAHRKFICGYPNEITLARAMPERERSFSWFFSGQMNHVRRTSCVAQAKTVPGGMLRENKQFWFGMPHGEYYEAMKSSRVALCPSGSASPDTIRLAEALECGCVPIADDRFPPGYPRNLAPGMTGFWEYVLGERPPFPIVDDWRRLPAMMEEILKNWDRYRATIGPWWERYKKSYSLWLREDLKSLGVP